MKKHSGSLLVITVIIIASVILTPKASVNIDSPTSFVKQVIEDKEKTNQPLPSPSVDVERLRRDISELLDGTRLRSAKWSVVVVSLDMGDTLFARNENLQVTPASNMKIVTTAAALHFLGPSFQYQTFLFGDGPIENGHLRGDLILYGTGDPGISDRFFPTRTHVFENLAKQLSVEGITHIDGNIVGDATYFSGPTLGPGWNPKDFNESFAAPVSSLSFNENVVTLRISPANRLGGVPIVETTPHGFSFETHNTAKTVSGRPRPKLWLDRPTPTSTARIAGEITHGGPVIWRRLTVPNPALFAVQALQRTLESHNITVGGDLISVHRSDLSKITGRKIWSPRIMREKEPRILARHTSPKIMEYLKVVNHESHNLFAEAIFKTIGKIVVGQGSFQGGSRAIRNFTVGEIGLSDNELVSTDGSGFSYNNQATAGGLVKILWYMSSSPQWNNFISTLPEAGRSLRRMYRTQAARNLRAKTGTIERVSGLTGLVSARNGERLLFSIISNNVPSTSAAKRVEDRIGVRLANFWRVIPDSSQVLGYSQSQ